MQYNLCIYCGKQDGTTMDHVPPRSIFPEKLPNNVNMVTAPACKQCHGENQKDDAIIRTLLISTKDTEAHPLVRDQLIGKRDRSLQRSFDRGTRELHDLLGVMVMVEPQTPSGIVLPKQPAFNFDNPTMDRFVERLARALLWRENKQPYFSGLFGWRMNIDLPHSVYTAMSRYGKFRKVHDAFAYMMTKQREEYPTWIVANFYGALEFLIQVRVGPEG